MKLYVITNIETVAYSSNLNDLNYRIVTTKPEALKLFEDWSLWQRVGEVLLEEYDTNNNERKALAIWRNGKVEAKDGDYATLAREINESIIACDNCDNDTELEVAEETEKAEAKAQEDQDVVD